VLYLYYKLFTTGIIFSCSAREKKINLLQWSQFSMLGMQAPFAIKYSTIRTLVLNKGRTQGEVKSTRHTVDRLDEISILDTEDSMIKFYQWLYI
jgi:hypothetical protein